MPVLLLRSRAHALRATSVVVVALLVALLSGAVALATGTSARTRAAAPARRVPDGLTAEQLWALAREERLATVRAAEAEASRAAVAARPRVVWPATGAVTGPFGERRGRSRHPGTDLDGETGDPVAAAAAGTVVWAGSAPAGYGGYGTVVIVDHGGGVQTLYAHLSAVAAAVGQAVGPGDRIGSIGSTGHSTGSHLHFEVRRNGVVTNPTAFLPPR